MEKPPTPLEDLKVTQKNELVYSAYSMSLAEKRLLLLVVAKLTPQNVAFPCWEIPVAQISNYLDIPERDLYTRLKGICRDLMSRVAQLRDRPNPKDWTMIQFVSMCRYISAKSHPRGVASLEIQLHSQMAPYLLQLKDHFQTIHFRAISSLSSIYAIRLYEILHHRRNESGQPKNEIQISIEELREMLELKKKYPNYADFKKTVLEPASRQISERTPLSMSYTEIRRRSRGAPVDSILFLIDEQKSEPPELPALSAQQLLNWDQKSEEEQLQEIFESFAKHIDKAAFKGLVHKKRREGYSYEYIIANLRQAALQIAAKPQKIDNFVKYLLGAIRDNWARVPRDM